MKKEGLEKILVGVLTISLMTNTMALLQPINAIDSSNNVNIKEISEDTISFNQEFAKLGESLTVSSNLTGDITYNWMVDGKTVSYATSYMPTENDLEKFISVKISNGIKTLSTKTYFSRLPVVYINTENGADITSKDYYINGEMKIQGNEQYNLETTKLYDGKMEIKGRGNSTWGLPKKPYKIKLDSKTNLFSMGKSKHWVLLANYYDSSNLRNTLSYDLSGALKMPQMDIVHTGVVLNGKYVGVYQFCEQIRVDEKRVDVLNWDDQAKELAKVVAKKEDLDADDLEAFLAENLNWASSGEFKYLGKNYVISNYDYTVSSIDGGYLLELDSNYDEISKFKTNSNQPIMFKAPEFANTNQDMMNYVKDYIQAYEDAVRSNDYHSMYEGNKVHYSELFDMDSLVDYWLVTELFFNEDGMKKSTYMYKDVDGKFHMGPIWDMDWSSGASQSSAIPTNQWQTLYFPTYGNSGEPQYRQWYRYLIKDPYFVSCVKQRYEEVRNNQIAEMMTSIEDYRSYLKEAGIANSSIWYNNTNSGENEINRLKSWLVSRLAFMDEQFSSLSKLYASLGVKVSDEKLVLKDLTGIVLPTENEYDGVSNALNVIRVEMDIADQNTKKVALYSNGQLIDELAVEEGKVIFEYTLPTSGDYVLQAYKLDQFNNVIGDRAISANLLVNPSVAKELEEIEIASLPNKLSYYQGEQLDLEGLAVNAVYNTGTKELLKSDEYTVSSLTDVTGIQTIIVSYSGKTASFEVEVKEVVLESLIIKQLPHKVDYHVGEQLDLTGLIVAGSYNNGEIKEITDYTVSKLTDKVGEQTVTITYQGLEVTFKVMVSSPIDTDINKIALSIAIDMANEVTQKELDKTVPLVANEFKAALAHAKTIFADPQASQDEIDKAFDRLANAMQKLEFYKGNKETLQKLIAQIDGLTASDYTDKTWQALETVLTKVDSVLNNENVLQPEVDEVYKELVIAFINLRLKPNKDLLAGLINQVNNLNAANYTPETWNTMTLALTDAKEIFNDPKATVEEVNSAKDVLAKALAGLVVNPLDTNISETKDSLTPVRSSTNNDKKEAIKTGDELPAYGLLAGFALLVSLIASKKGKCN